MIWTISNIITVARIALAPVIALLPFINGYLPKLAAFVVFLIASISDIYDGRLARERGEITDIGKELDPFADKLLLFATLVPIYWISRQPLHQYELLWWGRFPLWVVLILIGREITMMTLRRVAASRGVVIAAIGAGKVKTVFQSIFIGATILWFAWRDLSFQQDWLTGSFGLFWDHFHGTFVAVTLAIAVLLTVYSLAVYVYRFRGVLGGVTPPSPADGT